MSKLGKILPLALVAVFFVTALYSPVADAQVTQSYGGGVYGADSYVNYCRFLITMTSPNDQTTHTDKMLLKFSITWTTYPVFPFESAPPLYGYYAYSIDDGPFVEVTANQSANDVFRQTAKNEFLTNPSFSYLVDISNLEKGQHNIVINASLYHGYPLGHFYFNMTTSPYTFTADQTATTTPTVPEMPPLAVLPLIIPILIGVLIIKLKKQPSHIGL